LIGDVGFQVRPIARATCATGYLQQESSMVRMSRAITYGALSALLIGVLAFFGGWLTARAVGSSPIDTFFASVASGGARSQTPADTRAQFAVFWDVWDLVQSEFYHQTPLDSQKLVYGAVKGLLGTLDDQYTTFQEPDLAAQSRESMQGSFEGIGAFLRVTNGEIVIDRPIKGSPALKAGIQTGDVIVAVDGEALAPLIAGLSDADATAKAAAKIRGPKGSIVTISIRRGPGAQPFDVPITRDEVPIISVNAQVLDNGVAYIQITEFKATTTQLLDDALREIIPQHPRSIVLDLRNNPGGFLTTAQEVLGRFYDGVALYEEENDGVVKELKTIAGPADLRIYDLPMVVLINGGSASAAEIVAGALRDVRPNTSLLGEKSFGKGSVQNIHQLRDGSSARITIAHWLTPNRSAIHKIGITPQYQVANSDEAQYAVPCVADRRPPEGRMECGDAQLLWGLRLLMGETPPSPPA
jgi:carboxyl-terminal processing protease